MSLLQPVPMPSASASTTEIHAVRVPRERKKKYSMMKFSSGMDIDFVKMSQTSVKLERENNLREFKSAHDLETMPKFGGGSEFGREQKEEARKKKHGIMIKKYNVGDQPWIMKIGTGKQASRYKGVREGTISENTSYYIFTQCPDGAFEAFPIDEWYNFSPMIRYKYLNSDEAEEEFTRRDKTMNMWSIMVKKRIKNEDDREADGEDSEVKVKGKAKGKGKAKEKKSLQLTDMDDWMDSSEEEEEDDDDDEEDGEKSKKKKKDEEDDDTNVQKGKKKGGKGRKTKNSKQNSDDEAIEESDEGDFDDREVDYMSGSESSVSDFEDRDKEDRYEEKGVDQEDGLRKLIDSEESSDEEEKKEEKPPEEKTAKDSAKKEGSSDSSSSSSDSESDLEKDEKINSALFLQKKNGEKKRSTPVDEKSRSRSGTPTTVDMDDKRGLKRKMEGDVLDAKKSRTDSPKPTSSLAGASEGLTEDAIRRYLMRKPMTGKDLVAKFKSKKLNMSNEEKTKTIAQLLKKIAPEKKIVNKVMYLSLKKPE